MPGRHLFFFCGDSKFDFYKEKYKNDNSITIINLKVDNLTGKEHNNLWKTMSFWDYFKDFTHILTLQTDGCLCENSSIYCWGFLLILWFERILEALDIDDIEDIDAISGLILVLLNNIRRYLNSGLF